MFDLKIFLGFPRNEAFQKEIKRANPYLLSLFIGKEDYLRELDHDGLPYLGKYLPSFPTIEQLEDLEKHLVSLLHKLAPSYPFASTPPVLIVSHE